MKLTVSLVTEGNPEQISGGFLYQRRVAELAPAHGAEIRFVSLPPRRYPLAAVHVRGLLRAASAADVVVVDSLASNTVGPWLARGIDHPLVGSVHQQLGGTQRSRLGRMIRRRADLLAWRACRHIVVPSELLAGQLRRDGLVVPEIVVVNPGRDIPEHDALARTSLNLRQGRRVAVLCVASWVERKGIVALLDAIARLPSDLVTVHLVGDEDADRAYRARVLEHLARPELKGRVVRHGTVRPDRMVDLYAAADIFSLPSSEEPYGMVYAEAMTAGLPIVGWRAGNLPHLIDDGVDGRLVPPGDIGSLSRRIAELAIDDDLRRRLGRAALRRSRDLPTWEDTTAGFIDVCRRACSSA